MKTQFLLIVMLLAFTACKKERTPKIVLDVDGVIKEEKITNYVASDYDNWGTKTAFGTLYTAKNKATAKAAIVPADADKYKTGVEQAIDVFLKHHLNEFQSKYYR